MPRHSPSLQAAGTAIVSCDRCRRLRAYCAEVARVRKAAHRDDVYWGRPVPGFGDPDARVLVIGLAPAAHGANRTGRVFTGDGPGASGDFLMRAMHEAGFASLPTSRSPDDGLVLTGAFIAAAVRCAPPGNKPTTAEIAACHPHLLAEAEALANVTVLVALGRIAFESALKLVAAREPLPRPKPVFGHGAVCRTAAGLTIVGSYHPSRQNTNTGRLTPAMLAEVFHKARELAALSSSA